MENTSFRWTITALFPAYSARVFSTPAYLPGACGSGGV